MHSDDSQRAYTIGTGTSTTNKPVLDVRDPTQFDIYYDIGKFWQNQRDLRLWYLNSKSNASGQLLATWLLISSNSIVETISDTANTPVFPSSSGASPPDNIQLIGGTGITIVSSTGSNSLTITNTGISGNETLTGDDGVAVSPVGNTIRTIGNVVANSTHSKALFTTNPSTNIERFDLQLSASIAATDVSKVGVAAFNSSQFTVDANGFVTFSGVPGSAVTTLTGDDGVNVTPAAGIITLRGNTVTNAAHAKPVFFRQNAGTTEGLDVQLTTTTTSGAKNINKAGLAQFDSTQFTVDAPTGFISLVSVPGTTNIGVQTTSGAGTNPVVPNGSNVIEIDGSLVVSGTNPIRSVSTAVNTLQIQVQTAQAIASSNSTNVGLAAFNNTQFSVDANGFVSITSTPNFIWIEVTGTTQAMAVNRGYVANNAGLVTLTLPTTATFGDVIEVAGKGIGLWSIVQNANQVIHFGSTNTTVGVGGSLSAFQRYDTVRLLCTVAGTSTEWTVLSNQGNLTVV